MRDEVMDRFDAVVFSLGALASFFFATYGVWGLGESAPKAAVVPLGILGALVMCSGIVLTVKAIERATGLALVPPVADGE